MTNPPDPRAGAADRSRVPGHEPGDGAENDLDEELDAALESRHDPELGATLRALLGPTENLRSTARAGVDRTLQGRSVIATATDVAGAGWVAIWHLLTNPEADADREHMRERDDD